MNTTLSERASAEDDALCTHTFLGAGFTQC